MTDVEHTIENLRTLAEQNRERADDGRAHNPDYGRGMAMAYEDAANHLEKEVLTND